MRTLDQINKLKETFSAPYVVDDFITEADINQLESIFDTAHSKVYKSTGPVTLNLRMYHTHPVVANILRKIEQQIGPFDINAAFFFYTDYPHIIHNDDMMNLPEDTYKAVVVPLRLYGDSVTDQPHLCLFDQHYFHGPAKFFNGDKDLPTYYNKQIYDYGDVAGITNSEISEDMYGQYFTHLKREWLQGLSVQTVLPWVPGKCIIFDSVQLHCSSDFRKQNIKAKLAISIFTRKV